MQVSVEAPSKIQRRMTVVVPVEKLDAAYDDRIQKLAKTAKVNGFRPGKVPLNVIVQRFGESARQEALGEVIQSSLYTAMNQEKLNPIDTPTVEPKNIVPGQPLEYVAIFEVLPPVDKIIFDVPQLEKHVAVIKDEDVDKVLLHLREQHTAWKKVDRAAQEKDQVYIDFLGRIDGVPFNGGEAHDYPIVLGSKTMIPGFEEGILGAKAGDEIVVPVTFEENYFAKEVAGKLAEFTIKVIKIMQPELPALDEAFIKKIGVKETSIEGLRGEIRRNLERELTRMISSKLKMQVFDKLLELNPVEIPQSLIEREAKRIHDEMHPHHKGHDHGHSEEEMASFNVAAKRNVALGLLVGQLIKEHNMGLDLDRKKAFIENIASAYENPSEVMKWYLSDKRASAEVEMQVLEEQVTDKLLEGIQITEKMMSYNELVGNGQAA